VPSLRSEAFRRSVLRGALAVALAATGASARAGAPPSAAPLGVTTPGPIRQLFLDPVLADARAVDRPGLALRLESANSWTLPTVLVRDGHMVEVQTDAQADALVLALRIPWAGRDAQGWRRRVATTVGWRVTGFWGGFTDGAIQSWHGLIGSTDFARDRHPRDHVRIRLRDAGGARAVDLASGRLAHGDLVVGTQAVLAEGGSSRLRDAVEGDPGWAIAARLDVKLPVGSLARAGGSGGLDGGLSLLATTELAPWLVVHARASASALSGLAAPVALQPRTLQFGAEVSVVLLAGSWALVLEDRFLSPLFERGWSVVDGGDDETYIASAGPSLLRAHNQISVGIRYRGVTLSVSEDFTPGPNPRGAIRWFYNANAPDVVVALGVTAPL
jgi:hypothetical protein